MDTTNYNLIFTKKEFERIKSNDSFILLLSLARCINALRFCQKAGIDGLNHSNSSGARASINSFFFGISVLYEGFNTVEKISRHYKDLDSYKNGFGALLRDQKVLSFRKKIMGKARNRFVFHFDKDMAKEALGHFDNTNIPFVREIGGSSGELYFQMADDLSFDYLIDVEKNESKESIKERAASTLIEAADIMGRFSKSAELLIGDVLKELGIKITPEKNT